MPRTKRIPALLLSECWRILGAVQGTSAPGFPTNSCKNVPRASLAWQEFLGELLGFSLGFVTGCAPVPPDKPILLAFSQSFFFSLLWDKSRGSFGKGQDLKLLGTSLLGEISLMTQFRSFDLIQCFPSSPGAFGAVSSWELQIQGSVLVWGSTPAVELLFLVWGWWDLPPALGQIKRREIPK